MRTLSSQSSLRAWFAWTKVTCHNSSCPALVCVLQATAAQSLTFEPFSLWGGRDSLRWLMWLQDWLTLQGKVTGWSLVQAPRPSFSQQLCPSPQLPLQPKHFLRRALQWVLRKWPPGSSPWMRWGQHYPPQELKAENHYIREKNHN